MRKILLIMAILAICAHAQFTKVFEKPATASYTYAYDAERLNDIYPSYVAYQSGSTVSILNLNTLTVEYSADITPIKTATSGSTYVSIAFYKNLLQSDGKWTALIYSFLNSTSYVLGVFADGKYTQTAITTPTSTGTPTLRPAGGKIYLVANTGTSIEVYLVRNNVPTTSAILDNSKYMAALEKLNNKTGNNNHFNALGQQIPEIQYQELQEFMKKTYFENKGR